MTKPVRYTLATLCTIVWGGWAAFLTWFFFTMVNSDEASLAGKIAIGILAVFFDLFFIASVYFNFFDKDNENLGMDEVTNNIVKTKFENLTFKETTKSYFKQFLVIICIFLPINLIRGKENACVYSLLFAIIFPIISMTFDYVVFLFRKHRNN